MATTPAGRMLSRQLQQIQSDKDIPGISCGLVDNNVFEWEVMLMLSDDVNLYGGTFYPCYLLSLRSSVNPLLCQCHLRQMRTVTDYVRTMYRRLLQGPPFLSD